MIKLLMFIVSISALTFSGAQAKESKRGIASEDNRCIANLGHLGDTGKGTDTVKAFEPLRLTHCMQLSTTDKEIDVQSTMNGQPFVGKLKANQVPFTYSIGKYDYHIFNGKIVGVTEAKE